jgi:zinc protease
MFKMTHNPQRRHSLKRLGLLSTTTLLAANASWAASARPQTPSASTALSVPPLGATRRTLANGLEVLALPGGGTGSVSVQVWYRVGGKDDPPGRSGFAHLFEHLMFKGTRHMRAEQFDRLTEDVGGNNNAFTAEDVTVYQSVVPSHHLERLLWAEAERMSGLTVDEANFKSERAVVQEEFRQRVLADPYGRLFQAVAPTAFQVHPYHRPVIGSIADLDAATLDDVRAFHATYYRPDNAILIVVGDFEPAQLQAWVDRYFGPLSHPATPVPRVNVQEPAWRTSPAPVQLTGPNVPLPAVMLLWQAPKADSADVPALEVAQALLSAGESSRLYEALVHKQGLAQSVGLQGSFYADAGVLMAYGMAAGKHQPEALVAPILRELQRLADGPIPPAELGKIKTQVLTATLEGRQTPAGRADALGWAMIQTGDPAAADRELAALQAVSAADVRRVLRRYLIGQPMATVYYRQEARS